LPAGIYSITVKDNAGCTLQDQTIISPVPGPQKLWYTKKDAYCGLPAGAIVIDSVKAGTPPYSFAIDNGPFNPQKNFTNILPGSGTITVKDNYGCTFNEPYTIYQSEQLRIAINPRDTNICASEKITFIAALLSNNTGLQYLWNNERSTFINTFTTPVNTDSKMIVVATDKNGCTATDTATITTTYCDSLFAKCVLFPNAFSPNNDGLNDTFGPHLGSCEFKSYVMSIYNRWGQLVFETRDRSAKWTGATNGSTPQTGTYIYTCVWEDAAGHIHKHKGAVVLIR
jgi:gliding motility-associated-like protein